MAQAAEGQIVGNYPKNKSAAGALPLHKDKIP
jgi:hypothetical protein